VTGLGSGEGLISFLKNNEDDPRALVLESEFGRLLISMNRDGSTLSPMIRNAWDNFPLGRYVANPKLSGTIQNHHVGILANVTSTELACHLTNEHAAGGFGNRFLWLAVKRSRLLPLTEPLGPRVNLYATALADALAFAERGGLIRLTSAAKDWWNDYYRSRPERHGLLEALANRDTTQVARLAMLYALLDSTGTVDVPHFQAADALWDYAERSLVYVFGESTGNKTADSLLRMLRTQNRMSRMEVRQSLNVRSAPELDATIDHLTKLGLIKEVEVAHRGGPGRPRTDYVILDKGRERRT
jgi:hypothetical protein